MAQRISPSKIVTITKDGECHLTITLELNINLNSQAGDSPVTASIQSLDRFSPEEDNIQFELPDLSSGKMVSFGKD